MLLHIVMSATFFYNLLYTALLHMLNTVACCYALLRPPICCFEVPFNGCELPLLSR